MPVGAAVMADVGDPAAVLLAHERLVRAAALQIVESDCAMSFASGAAPGTCACAALASTATRAMSNVRFMTAPAPAARARSSSRRRAARTPRISDAVRSPIRRRRACRPTRRDRSAVVRDRSIAVSRSDRRTVSSSISARTMSRRNAVARRAGERHAIVVHRQLEPAPHAGQRATVGNRVVVVVDENRRRPVRAAATEPTSVR